MRCDNRKNRPWKECCNGCKELEYSCYICEGIVEVKIKIGHLEEHYNNPNLNITCNMCKVYKHISFFRFRNAKCRLCICFYRYRFGHTGSQFRELIQRIYVYKHNIKIWGWLCPWWASGIRLITVNYQLNPISAK